MVETIERPPVDPRFVQRLIDVRRAEGRRRMRILFAVGGTVAGLLIVLGIIYSPLMKVHHVDVTINAGRMTSEQVVKDAGLNHYELMIHVNGPRIAARLDAVPVLGAAQVSRHWPGTVRIAVTVRSPIAAVAGRGPGGHPSWALVDPTGRVLADVYTPPARVPLLQGLGAPPKPGDWLPGAAGPGAAPGPKLPDSVNIEAAADGPAVPRGTSAALAALQVLPRPVRAHVLGVSATASGTLSMEVVPVGPGRAPIPVVLGDGSLLGQKMEALATLLTDQTLTGVTSINLTVPRRPAVLTAVQ
jgi:POTRA domain, FtsQ-type